MKFHLSAFLILFGLAAGVAPAAQAAVRTQQTNTTRNGIDKAYLNGYDAGYAAGQQDRQADQAANAHKFSQYQQAIDGYTPSYGTREAYRTGFQSGFDDGYGDGYANRPPSVGPDAATTPPASSVATAPPAASPMTTTGADDSETATPNLPAYSTAPVNQSPVAAPTDPASVARANGYREGYNAGKYDLDRGATSSPTTNAEYTQGEVGYDPALGAVNEYEKNFRDGFATGYADGYARRLYNSSIGARPDANPAVASALTASAGASAFTPATATSPATAPPPVAPPPPVVVPQGTVIQTVLNNNIDTKNSKVGDPFTASVTVPVWVGSTVAIPAGSTISGTVAKVQEAGKMSGQSELQLQYNTIQVPGSPPVQLAATTSGVGSGTGSTNGEGSVDGGSADGDRRVGTDSAIGAGIGGIFGGLGGLMRGAIAGAVVGAAGAMTSKKKDVVLKTGQNLTIRTDQPLQVQPIGTAQSPSGH